MKEVIGDLCLWSYCHLNNHDTCFHLLHSRRQRKREWMSRIVFFGLILQKRRIFVEKTQFTLGKNTHTHDKII